MIQHRTKHFLAVAILVAGTLAAYAAFPTKENWEIVNPDEVTGNWDSFKFNWIGMNDQHVTLVLSNSAGYVSVTNYFVQARLSKDGTIYTEVNNANITKTVTSVAFQVAATNIGPVDTYQAEVFCWEGASSNLARTLAQGKVVVSKSLYSDTNAFPFPASLTNLNAIPRTEAEATNAIFRAGIALAQAGVVSNGAYLVEQGNTNSQQQTAISGLNSTNLAQDSAMTINSNRITVVETGKVDKESTNGWEVGTHSVLLPLDGSRAMTGNLVMGLGTVVSNADGFRFNGNEYLIYGGGELVLRTAPGYIYSWLAGNFTTTNVTLGADGSGSQAVRYSQLGNAAFSNGADFASAADGVLAQSAVQPATLAATGMAWRAEWQNGAGITNLPTVPSATNANFATVSGTASNLTPALSNQFYLAGSKVVSATNANFATVSGTASNLTPALSNQFYLAGSKVVSATNANFATVASISSNLTAALSNKFYLAGSKVVSATNSDYATYSGIASNLTLAQSNKFYLAGSKVVSATNADLATWAASASNANYATVAGTSSNLTAAGHVTALASNQYDIGSAAMPFRDGYFSTGSVYLGSTPLTQSKVQTYDGYASTKANQSSVNTLSTRVDNQALMSAEMMLNVEALGEWTAHPYYSALPDYFTDQTWYDSANSTNTTYSLARYSFISEAESGGSTLVHLKMNDNAANKIVDDSSSNGWNFTSISDTSAMATNGMINGALNFTAPTDYLTRTEFQPSMGATNWSVATWFKFTGNGQTDWGEFLFWWGGSTHIRIGLSYTEPNLLGVMGGGDWLFRHNHGSSYNDDAWHHTAVTYDGTNVQMYLEGELTDTATITLALNFGDLFIGSGNGESQWTGQMDDVRIYDHAISSNDVAVIYNEGTGTESDGDVTLNYYGKLQSLPWSTPLTNNACTVVALADKTALPPATNWWFDVSPDNGSTWSNISLSSSGVFSPATNYTRWTGSTMYGVYGSQWVYRASWSNAETMKLKGAVLYVETK